MYSITPIKLGVEVKGIDLKTEQPAHIIDQIVKDVHKYKIMIFKNQGQVTGKRQVEISKWFGELESTFYKHPASPDPDVFRVSNDEQEGCTGVGRTGWHIDGSFQPEPFAYSIYHMISVPERGATGSNHHYTASRYNLAVDTSWPPSSYFEISINLKGCIILEWYIRIRFMISTTFKSCATKQLSV